MPQTQTAPHLEELVRALGEKVGRDVTVEALEAELGRYLEFGVPPEQARSIILRKFGVNAPKGPSKAVRKTLEEVQPNENFVNLLVRIVSIQPKEITVRGEKKTIQFGILGDESRTRPFTSWKILEIEKGDVIRVTGAYTKEFQGEPQINFGDRVQIEKVEPTLLPPPPQGQAAAATTSGLRRVAELKPGDSGVEVTARVLHIEAKEVQVQGQPKTVYSGTMADTSGKVQFNAWQDFGLKVGDVVRLAGAYVKGWRGTSQLTFDEKTTVEHKAPSTLPSLKEMENQGPVPIASFIHGGGQMDVLVEATLLEVKPGSGLVLRCPDCKRVLQDTICRLHGKQTGNPDLRIKAVLDDGSGAVSAIFSKEITEALLGRTMEEFTAMAKQAATPDVVETEARGKLVARTLRVRGNVLVDEFGPMFLAKEAAFVQRDLAAAAEALLAELEGVV
jgi:replication factor A1